MACYDILMTTIRAHFDGKVFVPDEPVDLPIGKRVEIPVRADQRTESEGTLADLADWIEKQPPVDRGDMPTDGSINYKHYLYGHPKQP